MRLLLDTHAFLWWVDDNRRLSRKARAAIASREHSCYFSLASVWEMAIKASLDRLSLPSGLDRFVSEQMAANAFEPLPIDLRHAGDAARLRFTTATPSIACLPRRRSAKTSRSSWRIPSSRSMVLSECGEGHFPPTGP